MSGGNDNDLLLGEDGNDSMRGGSDDDTLYGHAGDDYQDGRQGDDYILGNDQLILISAVDKAIARFRFLFGNRGDLFPAKFADLMKCCQNRL